MKRTRSSAAAIAVATALLAAWLPAGDRRPTAAAAAPAAQPQAPPGGAWPRHYKTDGHTVQLYQPQVDAWENHARIVFRAAVGVLPKGKKGYAYGIAEVEAATQVDYASRVVVVSNAKRELRFPNATVDDAARLAAIVNAAIPPQASITVPLDVVLAYVRDAAQQREVTVNLDPPQIFYSQKPAILLMFMGEPKLKPVPGAAALMFAVNTNWDLFHDLGTTQYLLLNGDTWLTAPDPLKGPWAPATSLPASLSALPSEPGWADVKKAIPGRRVTTAPVVFTATTPAEMILVEGAPTYSPVRGTKLLYVTNTASVVFFHSAEQQFYYLVAGRWFRARTLGGPWAAATKDLPADFRQIPLDHPMAAVRASVPGTEEAKDAILLASIPQRVEIKVGQAPSVAVVYEGVPKLEPIPATTVTYVVNTPYDVFAVDGHYYWAYQGVWYCGSAANGPWAVCTAVPSGLYQIPVSHPKHYVTYVTVYQSTPDVVVVQSTAGYQGQYVAAGVVMFGAGMLVGAALASDNHYYYYGWPPPPAHYSYGTSAYYSYRAGGYYSSAYAYGPYGSAGAWAGYNPATGTYARGGYASGPYGSAGWAAAYNPYTGGAAAGRQVSTAYGSRGSYAAYNPYTGVYSHGGYATGARGSAAWQSGYNPATGASAGRGYVQSGDQWARGGYASTSEGTVAGVQTSRGGAAVGASTSQGQAAVGRTASGDVYAGSDGTVYKRSTDGTWQKNTGSGWQSTQPPSQVNRDSATRQRSGQMSYSGRGAARRGGRR
jgi:hypothetical protein